MILHCFGESGNAYKAALTLEFAGLDWQPEFVDFFHGATRTPEFRALNSMGEVPVLVDGDLVLSQSGVIQDYVVERTGKLGSADPATRREILRWVIFDNQKVSGQAGPLRFNMNFLPEDRRSSDVNAFLAMRLASALKVLDTVLADRCWLVGEHVTIADLACCGYLFYEEPFGFDRAGYSNIDRWLDRIAALPGWRHPYALMPRAGGRVTVWAFTFAGAAALLVAGALAAAVFAASMPRALGLGPDAVLNDRQKVALFGATIVAGAPVLTLSAIALGHVPEAALVALAAVAGAAVYAPAALAPAGLLRRLRSARPWLAAGAVICCAAAIGARIGQDAALFRGERACFDRATAAEVARCRAEFARTWRMPTALPTSPAPAPQAAPAAPRLPLTDR